VLGQPLLHPTLLGLSSILLLARSELLGAPPLDQPEIER